MLTADQIADAKGFLCLDDVWGPDAEDNERFASRYGASLIAMAEAFGPLLSAAQALGAMPEGYCFCSQDRIGDDSKQHEPECAELRAAIATAEGQASPQTKKGEEHVG